MQCELKLTKAFLLTYTKKDIKELMYIGIAKALILIFGVYIISCFFCYDFVPLLKYCMYGALFLVPILLLLGYSQVFIACHNSIKMIEFKDDIKQAMQKKHGS